MKVIFIAPLLLALLFQTMRLWVYALDAPLDALDVLDAPLDVLDLKRRLRRRAIALRLAFSIGVSK